jgi:hypothetical protein
MSIHSNPTELARALGKANKKITAVTYEYPGIWSIETKTRRYDLGTANETVGWNEATTGLLGGELEGSDENTAPDVIAKAFSAWLEALVEEVN